NTAHFCKIDDSTLVEGRREKRCCNLCGFIGNRIARLFPAIESAIENIDVLHAHNAKHPPDTRCGKHTRSVIDHNGIVNGDSHSADMPGKKLRRWQCVRQTGVLVSDLVLIEENCARNMGSI